MIRRKHLHPLYLLAALALTLTLAGCGSDAGQAAGYSAAKEVTILEEGSDLVIPLSDVSATAAFYPVEIDGTALEVIAVKTEDGAIRTAFNTCQVCYDSGRGYYKQSGNVLICQNCGNRFRMSQVEIEAGGCNPWPIFEENKTVTDESITIAYDFLTQATAIFANWKGSY
jgi:uncharacterized membrane protein